MNYIYKNTVKLCSDIDIPIPTSRKRKISSKVDTSHTNQYFFQTKEEEMKLTVYYTALDQMINGISIRFNQETINMIKSIANLTILQTNYDNVCTLASSFNLDTLTLQTEIRLLQNYDSVPKNILKNKCDEWIKWLSSCDRQNIFPSITKAFKLFVTIPVTSCSCERTFSKLIWLKQSYEVRWVRKD